MSDGGSATVGLVGDASDAFGDGVTEAGGDLLAGTAEDVLDGRPTVVVANGEAAFLDVASEGPAVPVLPVDAGRGVRSLPGTALPDAASALVDGEWTTESHPLLSVAVDGTERWTAVTDVALVTAEAAHISEYDVVAGEERLDCIRADGVVVATPAGSTGYARRLGGPVLAPGTVAVVVPIAPFATDPNHWVVDPDGLEVALERDDAPVELVVDDAVATEVDPSETVALSLAGHVETAVLSASRSRYE